ncbi:hypothetical protein BD779DRAFT_1670727 [Infundibulicybe gibba]|nr:hypothetical protein BD779DRAFT_1670727 [Infundibulicybe gibba]
MPTTQSPSQDQYTISLVPLTFRRGGTPNHDITSTASRTVQKTSQLIPKKSSKPGTKLKRHLCPIAGCGETFTRRNDVLRHQRNAAKHRGIFRQNQDEESRTRCKFCGEELSRADARKRHELKASCGKRTIRKKVLGDPSTTQAHL